MDLHTQQNLPPARLRTLEPANLELPLQLIFSSDAKLGDAVIEGLAQTLDDGGLVEVLFALAGRVFCLRTVFQ